MPPNGNPCTNAVSVSQIVNIETLPIIESVIATDSEGNILDENNGICAGETINLSITPNSLTGTGSIISGNGILNNTSYQSVLTDGDTNVNLKFTADVGAACSNTEVSDEIIIPIYALPDASATAQINDGVIIPLPNNQVDICEGDKLRLEVSQNVELGNHLWTNNLDATTGSTDFIIVYPMTDVTYYVTYRNETTLCENSDTITVNVAPKPSVSNISTSCNAQTSEYTVTGTYEPIDATVSIDNNLSITAENGNFEYTAAVGIDSAGVSLATTFCNETFYVQSPNCECPTIDMPQSDTTDYII